MELKKALMEAAEKIEDLQKQINMLTEENEYLRKQVKDIQENKYALDYSNYEEEWWT